MLSYCKQNGVLNLKLTFMYYVSTVIDKKNPYPLLLLKNQMVSKAGRCEDEWFIRIYRCKPSRSY